MASSSPKLRFSTTIARAEFLLELQEALITAPPEQAARRDDVARAAIVMAVAAMDAYFTDKYCAMLVPFIKKHGATPQIAARLQSAGLDVSQSLEMATMKRPFARVLALMRAHLERKTTQRREAIDALFKDYGVKNLVAEVEDVARRKTLFARIEILVERRHAIVHAGDLNGKSRVNNVDVEDIRKRIADVKVLVLQADHYLYKKFGPIGG